MADDYYEKFYGKTEQSAYLLFYRRVNPVEDFGAYSINIGVKDPAYREIVEHNRMIEEARASYEMMKSHIRIKFVFFETLTSLELLEELNPTMLLDHSIPEELIMEFILNKKDVYGLVEELEQKCEIKLSDYDCYEIIVKTNRVVYYKHKINFEYLLGMDEQTIDVSYSATFVLVDKVASLENPFFAHFTSGNVRLLGASQSRYQGWVRHIQRDCVQENRLGGFLVDCQSSR